MAEEYGPTFITVTDEDGREIVLEFIDALELEPVVLLQLSCRGAAPAGKHGNYG